MRLFECRAFSFTCLAPVSAPPHTHIHLSVLCVLVCLCLCAHRLYSAGPGIISGTVKVKDGPARGWQHLPHAHRWGVTATPHTPRSCWLCCLSLPFSPCSVWTKTDEAPSFHLFFLHTTTDVFGQMCLSEMFPQLEKDKKYDKNVISRCKKKWHKCKQHHSFVHHCVWSVITPTPKKKIFVHAGINGLVYWIVQTKWGSCSVAANPSVSVRLSQINSIKVHCSRI